MEFLCCKCHKRIEVDSVGEFALHLRQQHALCDKERLMCGQNGCCRTFSLMNSLLKHIRREHVPQNVRAHGDNAEFRQEQNIENNDGHDLNSDSEDGNDLDDYEDCRQTEVQYMQNFDIKSLKKLAFSMVIKLKSMSSVPFSAIQTAINSTKTMFCDTLSSLQHRMISVMQNHGIDVNADDVVELSSKFDEYKNPFQGFETPKQQMDCLIEDLMLVPPVEKALGVRLDQGIDRKTGQRTQKLVTNTFQYVPVLEVLKLILNTKLRRLFDGEAHAPPGFLKGYVDGEQYEQHQLFRDHPHALRFVLYYDDVEVCNPLGSKAGPHKLGMFYYSLQNVPVHMNSGMNTVFLLAVCYASDLKKFGFQPILEPFIDEIKKLESEAGVTLNVHGQEVTVHGTLVAFSGDSLAAHDILGFLSPAANKLCILCKCSRSDIQESFIEKAFLLRSVQDHNESVQLASQRQHGDPTSGVRNECVLNTLQNFHCVTNCNFDIMHDLQEGVIPYEVKLVLHRLVYVDKLLTMDEVNQRLHSFSYSYSDRKNKPSCIMPERIKNLDDHKIGQKAAQMSCLVRMLPFLIGDKIPHDNPDYELILLLRRCLDIIYAPVVSVAQTIYLEQLIEEHHEHFKAVFPDQRFINKHHHMVHYGRCIRKAGPLANVQCLKYEMKHATAKRLASVQCNFKNICKSVATKYQVIQSAAWAANNEPWSSLECTSGSMAIVSDLKGCETVAEALQVEEDAQVFVAERLIVYGTEYRPNMYLALGMSDGMPVFGKISSILMFGQTPENVKFVAQKCKNLGFFHHYHAYGVGVEAADEYTVTSLYNLISHMPLSELTSYDNDSLIYVCPRHTFVQLW